MVLICPIVFYCLTHLSLQVEAAEEVAAAEAKNVVKVIVFKITHTRGRRKDFNTMHLFLHAKISL